MVNSSMGPADFDIFLKPLKKPKMTVWLIVPWGRADFDIFLKPYKKMIVWLILPWGRRILISSWNPKRNPKWLYGQFFQGAGGFWYLLETL